MIRLGYEDTAKDAMISADSPRTRFVRFSCSRQESFVSVARRRMSLSSGPISSSIAFITGCSVKSIHRR